MRIYEQVLGKVSVTPEGNWENKEYDRLCLVRHPYTGCVYLSKKAVPIDIDLDNTEYWMFIGEGITREELNDILSRFSGFIVVTTLPETGDATKIYLLGPIGTGTDKYEEWIYSNTSWVKIGDTSIDLSGYIKKVDVPIEKGTGDDSVIQKGSNNQASGNYSACFGRNNKCLGRHSFAEGLLNTASGNESHAEGTNTIAEGNQSHAEGGFSAARSQYSHSEGDSCTSSGDASHAEGKGSVTNNIGEHSEGQFNISIPGITIHTVGIGSHSSTRKNAHTVTTDGKHYIPGVGGYTGEENTEALLNSRQDLAAVINNKVERVFIAMEGSTSFADIKAAIDAGREVLCLGPGGYAHLIEKTSSYIVFATLPNSGYNGSSRKATIDNNNNWTPSYVGFNLVYDTINKKLKKSYDDSTYTDVVTAAKIVEDGMATANLISQEDFNVIFN